MAHWTDPDTDDIRPPSPIGMAAGLLCIFALFLVAIVAWAHDADAATLRCGGPCPTVPTTTGSTTTTEPEGDPEPTTTTSTTVATTTTEQTTTTTVGATTTTPNVGICCLQAATTTTTAPASTVTTTATMAPPTTTATTVKATTVPPTTVDPGQLPATEADAPAPVETLPVTGGNPAWLVLFALCVIALGGLAVLWVRS